MKTLYCMFVCPTYKISESYRNGVLSSAYNYTNRFFNHCFDHYLIKYIFSHEKMPKDAQNV